MTTRLSNWYRIAFGIAALWCTLGSITCGQGIEARALRAKQEDQQRARVMTRELVGTVLDVQLRQLEDNGLEDMPVYNDIQLMRKNLAAVVDGEMVKVVELLTEAQSLPADQRQAAFVDARKQIRSIVVRLTAERQSLLRRLRMAELAEQARRLIGIQDGVRTVTVSLPEESKSKQEALLLKTQEDQRDVKELFLQLVQTLDDVRQWGGPVAEASTDGLRLLKAGDVGKHVDRAEAELVAAQPPKAIEHQDAVLKGLRDLLKILERTQGAISNENREALDRIRAITEKQQQLQQETKALDPKQPPPEAVVEKQAQIQTAVAELQKLLPELPTAERLTEQAEAAAKDATAALFDGQLPTAVAEQSEVLGNLAALEQLLAQGADEPASDRTAEELAKMVAELEQAKAKLEEAAKKQDAAQQQADKNTKEAAPLEKQAAEAIEAAKNVGELPSEVERRLEEAEQAALSAEAALAAAAGEAGAKEDAALAKADEALDRARASVEAALKDAKRQAAAVKIGELARAAEALERAAAEERAIAKEANVAAADQQVTADEAQGLSARQQEVEAITDKLAEALKSVSPESANTVAKAAEVAEKAGDQFENAAKADAAPDAATKSTQTGAEGAREAAKQLSAAAQQLRDEVRQAALELATESQQQAEELATARDAVEDALNGPTVSLAEQMAQLQAAQKKTAEAARQQQQASGRPEAAQAMALTEQIAEAQAAQQIADNAAEDLANGAAATPLKASAQQQAVAEMAEAAANQAASTELKSALKTAQAAASKAAKDLFDGKIAAAQDAQKQADAALDQAAQLAQAAAQSAMQAAPTAKPDPVAQKQAEQAARAAENFAGADAPMAAEALGDAAEAGADAAQELAAGQPDAAKSAQQQAEKKLAQAQQQLQSALKDLAMKQQAELAKQAAQTDALAEKTAMLEPTATEAIEAAQTAATNGAQAGRDPSDQVNAAMSAERQLERAAATLAAKEQHVRRDQSVAQALAALAAQQKDAAKMLDEQRALAEAKTPGVEPTNPEAFNAEKAAQAAADFAEAQRATGQGAAEVSGQQQVANPPLREALQMAAALPSSQQAAAMAGEKPLVGELKPLPMPTDPAGKPMPADGAPMGEGTPSEDAPGQPGDAAGQQGTPTGEPGMGDTGFVPQSPELTAQLLAGPEATAAIQAAQQLPPGAKAQPTPNPNSSATPPSQQANSQSTPMPDGTPGTGFTGPKQTAETKNNPIKDGPLDKQPEKTDQGDNKAGKREGDTDPAARQFEDQPWFAKLPPELRRSIRAGAQQKSPRAYEERLKRYFQSVD